MLPSLSALIPDAISGAEALSLAQRARDQRGELTAGRAMTSLIGRDGSCASCHKLPTKDSFDPLLGTAHDSAGVILVDPLAVDVETCGGAP